MESIIINKDKPAELHLPWIEHNVTPLRQVELCELFVQAINDWMRKIRKMLGIEKKVHLRGKAYFLDLHEALGH